MLLRGPRNAAFLVVPHMGGTYSVFVALRQALAQQGLTLDWVGYSKNAKAIQADPFFAKEASRGHLIDAGNMPDGQIGAALVQQLARYDLVFLNVLTGIPEMSVAANLPPQIRRVMIVHNITPGTYAAAKAVAPFVHAAVGVAPRIQNDLRRKLRLSATPVFCVPNAIDLSAFQDLPPRNRTETVRIISLGRVVDADKGVFWLPRILAKLSDIPISLTVAGDGPDLPELRRRAEPLKERITFLGRMDREQVPELLQNHDILLMPSRFEGFGYTLIEAMAAGCVPVASRVSGVTDFVVQEEKDGLLFPIGNVAAAANAIRRLAGDQAALDRLSAAGPPAVADRFSIESFARGYTEVIRQVATSVASVPPPPADEFQLLSVGGGWRRHIPLPVKNLLRNYLNR